MKILSLLTPLALAFAAALPLSAQAHGSAHADGAPSATTEAPPEQTDWGVAAPGGARARTVSLTMDDRMRFTPDTLTVREGEVLRLRIANRGALMHEFVLGTPATLEEHAALMLKFPDMVHGDPWMVHVPPGETGEIVWRFNRAGDFAFACLIAGHYQSGMRGSVRVLPRQGRGQAAVAAPARPASNAGADHAHH